MVMVDDFDEDGTTTARKNPNVTPPLTNQWGYKDIHFFDTRAILWMDAWFVK
jgi:hypothetical protein